MIAEKTTNIQPTQFLPVDRGASSPSISVSSSAVSCMTLNSNSSSPISMTGESQFMDNALHEIPVPSREMTDSLSEYIGGTVPYKKLEQALSSELPAESYPVNLNPFGDLDSLTSSIDMNVDSTIDQSVCSTNPFDNLFDNASISQTEVSNRSSIHPSCRTVDVVRKSIAPTNIKRSFNEPLYSQTTLHDDRVRDFSDIILHNHSQSSDSERLTDPYSDRNYQNYSYSSTVSRRNSRNISTGHHSKRPAPPQPIPNKRTIRTDEEYHHDKCDYGTFRRKLSTLNSQLVNIENSVRGLQEDIHSTSRDEFKTMVGRWLDLVAKKDDVFNQEHHVLQRLEQMELDDRHADIEHELRRIMAKQEPLKSHEERLREKQLLRELVSIVEKRADLVSVDTADHGVERNINNQSGSIRNKIGAAVRRYSFVSCINVTAVDRSSRNSYHDSKMQRIKSRLPSLPKLNLRKRSRSLLSLASCVIQPPSSSYQLDP